MRRSRGFTLLEIAIVIAIMGLLAAGLTALFTTFLKSTRSRVAAENAVVVQQALQRFVERYGRLPCPAVPTLAPGAAGYGVEDTVTTVLATSCPNVAVAATNMARGVVPSVTLGLPLDQVQDGYSRMFTYHVSIAGTITNSGTVSAARGNMTIHTATPTALGLPATGNQINSCWTAGGAPPAGENSCNMNAIVVLVSHGENGAGAFTSQGGQLPASAVAAEIENSDANVGFVKGDPAATGYDDVVFAWSPDDLLESLARQGTVKSATATTTETLRSTAIAISNFIVNNTVAPNVYAIPAASPVALPNDAWGTVLVYAAPNAGNQMCATMPPGTTVPVVFSLTSPGIDGVAGLNANTGRNDDLSVSVTVDPLRNQINNRAGFAC